MTKMNPFAMYEAGMHRIDPERRETDKLIMPDNFV